MKSKRKRVAQSPDKLRDLLEARSEFLRMIREYPELCCADADAELLSVFATPHDHRRYIVRPPRIH